MERKYNTGYVYLLSDDNKQHFKIGVTRGNLENRIKKLQTGNPMKILLIDYYETPYPFRLEKMLHDKFQYKNVLNEWYELTEQEVLDFKKICIEKEEIIKHLKSNYFFNKNLK